MENASDEELKFEPREQFVDQQDKPVGQPDKPAEQPENPVDKPESKKRGKKTLVLKKKSLERLKRYEDAVSCAFEYFRPTIYKQ